jgi:hypothetical protein
MGEARECEDSHPLGNHEKGAEHEALPFTSTENPEAKWTF